MLDLNQDGFLTTSQIKERAKSVFTETAGPGTSEKFTHIPTHKVIDDMDQLGWKVVDAKEVKARVKSSIGFQKHLVVFRNPDVVINGEDGDTVLDLKKFIWREKLGDLRVGYGRMQVVYMKDIQDSEHVILDNDFRLDQDDIKEKISEGVLSIVSPKLDFGFKIHDLSGEDLSMINLKNKNQKSIVGTLTQGCRHTLPLIYS